MPAWTHLPNAASKPGAMPRRVVLIVKLQRQIVYELRAIGRDSKAAEDLLSQFERSQEIFERELAAFS